MERKLFFRMSFLVLAGCLLLQAGTVAAAETEAVSLSGPGTDVMVDNGSWGRDPFEMDPGTAAENESSVKEKQIPVPAVRLTGIMEANGKYTALVNGRNVSTGDKVDGVLIRKIHKRGIVIKEMSGSREILILEPGNGSVITSRVK